MHLLLRPYQRLQTRIFPPEGPRAPQLATQARRAISFIRAGEEIVPDGREPIAQPILPDVSQWKPPGNNCSQHPGQWWKQGWLFKRAWPWYWRGWIYHRPQAKTLDSRSRSTGGSHTICSVMHRYATIAMPMRSAPMPMHTNDIDPAPRRTGNGPQLSSQWM